ncbi:MAG: 30S ribosome-binding factor RbfA [Gammaproteobacteria bacterium]|nr:30S ribosome-binding factor RbfA [Gammaproteobacteria bacterium]MYH13633.1 30S ribosome-binding factor RbfA [Gammaproteobacteria bacterium]MYK81952.1 30S ribosome-binding factor RbfA [Gammaproteobacteria bacterium]
MPEAGLHLRMADFAREEIARIIQFEMRDPRIGMVSVNDVRVSRDLAFADVYVSAMPSGSPEDQEALVAVLNGASGYFRSKLARRHRMRTTPKPRFHYDESVERGRRLERLIDQAVAEGGAGDV